MLYSHTNYLNVSPKPTKTTSSPQPLQPAQLSPVRSTTVADEMRQQRNDEAKALIGSRVGTAKAIFTQHTASGQMHSPTSGGGSGAGTGASGGNTVSPGASRSPAPAKPARNSIAQRINTFNNAASNNTEAETTKTNIPAAVPEFPDDEENISKTGANLAEEKTSTNGHHQNTAITTDDEIATTTTTAAAATAPTVPSSQTPLETTEANVAAISPQSHGAVEAEPDESTADQFSTIKRSPYTKQGSTASSNSQVATPVSESERTVSSSSEMAMADTTTVSSGFGDSVSMSMVSDASRGVVIKNGMRKTLPKGGLR